MKLRLPVLLTLLVGGLLSGCISHTRTLPMQSRLLKAESMTKAALLDKLRAQSLAIKTLTVSNSSMKASYLRTREAITDFTGVSGVIVVNRPDDIYVEIRKFGLTAVDMVSDGKTYKVSIPAKSLFGVNEVATSADSVKFPYSLRPSHILDALFVDGEQFVGVDDITVTLREGTDPLPDGVHSVYIINFWKQGVTPLEELWVDRIDNNMDVTRKIKYRETGQVESEIRYSEYENFDSIRFPKMIVITRPIENYSLQMELAKLELNKPVVPGAFVLPKPSGANEINLNTGKKIDTNQ